MINIVWKYVFLRCSDGVFDVFNFIDEWFYILKYFLDKFYFSFELGNLGLRLIIVKVYRCFFILI